MLIDCSFHKGFREEYVWPLCRALCSCAITLLLPETLGVPLVESIDEVENLYVRTKPFFAWWSRAQLKESVEKNMLLIARKRESPPP